MTEPLDVARLAAILQTATGLRPKVGEDGATVMFPKGQVIAVQRAALVLAGPGVRLWMWPAELGAQYKAVYSKPQRVESLLALSDQQRWEVKANFHLAYWLSAPKKRWYPTKHLSGHDYARQWIDDFRERRAGRWPVDRLQSPEFRNWLVDRRYASEGELAELDAWAAQLPRDHFDVRPGIEVSRTWNIDDAKERDRRGLLTTDVRQGINQVLQALGDLRIEDPLPHSGALNQPSDRDR